MLKYAIPLILALTTTAFCESLTPPNPRRDTITPPKAIVLIYADDLGYGDTGCYGAKDIPTPAIDKLAQQGIRFTNAYSTSAVCTPSRYALLTGEYPWRKEGTGILPGDAALIIDPSKPTLPSMLQSQGYKTYMIGKWHLGLGDGKKPLDWNKHISPGPNEIGFNESFIFAATGDRVPCVILENGKVRNLDPEDPIEISYRSNFPGLPNGKDHQNLLKLMWSHGHNQAVVNGIGRIGYMKGGKNALWKDEENADLITNKAIEYIEKSAKANEPFFLMFATHDIHVPRCPGNRFAGKSPRGVRGDVILELDHCVERIMDALKTHGLEKDALVIFSSDNGPVLDDGYRDNAHQDNGDHKPSGPFRAGKYSILEGGTRIPFIVKWPAQITQGKTSQALFNQMDLGASLEHILTRSNTPAKSNCKTFRDSEDLMYSLLGQSTTGRKYHVVHSSGKGLALRHQNWKYIPPGTVIRDGLNGTGASISKAPQKDCLFDLESDPQELHNLAEQHPDICRQLQNKLEEIRQQPDDRKQPPFATSTLNK